MQVPDITFVGHITRDLLPGGGWMPGGSVVYGAHLAARWGFRPAVLTAMAAEAEAREALPDAADVVVLPSPETTTFRNTGDKPRRQQVFSIASPITADAMPAHWIDAYSAFIAPVIGEVAPGFVRSAGLRGEIGVGLQGWLRTLDSEGNVKLIDARTLDLPGLLAGVHAAFLSDEDLAATPVFESVLSAAASISTYVLLTHGDHGSTLYSREGSGEVRAYPARVIDPTGAGDTFATAYLLGRVMGESPVGAAQLAAAAAACSVEGVGVAALPTLSQARQRMAGAA